MKKILFAAMALGMTMTSCMNDEFPNATRYGYIDVNVSNDPVIQTRTLQTVSGDDLKSWTITATNTTDNTKIYNLTESKVVPAGTYKIEVSSHNDIDAANVVGNFGKPYYTCTTSAEGELIGEEKKNQNVAVSAGSTATAEIYCGRAKNARIKLVDQLNTGLTSTPFSEVKLITSAIGNRPSVELTNGQVAYFTPEVTVPYSISYTYGEEEKTLSALSIQIGGAATESVITLKSNSSGQITISIYVDDAFGEGAEEEITFDAATGNKAE